MRYASYYIHGGAADHVVVIDNGDYGDGTGTSVVVDKDVIRDFQSDAPEWSNWSGDDLDFLNEAPSQLTYEELEEGFAGSVIAVRFDDEPVRVLDSERWSERQAFYGR